MIKNISYEVFAFIFLILLLFMFSPRPILAASASLELQGKCSSQAHRALAQSGFDASDFPKAENHYNEKLGKCFIMIYTTSAHKNGLSRYIFLQDAFENRDYGECFFSLVKDGKNQMFTCRVMLPDGEKICHSFEEFIELTKYYME